MKRESNSGETQMTKPLKNGKYNYSFGMGKTKTWIMLNRFWLGCYKTPLCLWLLPFPLLVLFWYRLLCFSLFLLDFFWEKEAAISGSPPFSFPHFPKSPTLWLLPLSHPFNPSFSLWQFTSDATHTGSVQKDLDVYKTTLPSDCGHEWGPGTTLLKKCNVVIFTMTSELIIFF